MLVFKRNMTRADCIADSFSGIRKCEVSNNHEIWVKGRLVKEVSETQAAMDKDAVAKAYAEVFKLGIEQVVIV